ncbi:MAG: acyl-CoA dehydrogenase family protein [Gemmobacter sp.]|jgi:acyl-CoA dehydrogenase|nr:acyl-CoA dehydrogenase family protein [Gemmobacter sp.]
MDTLDPQTPSYTLPPEVVAYRDLARQIVRNELMPLEPEYLASPHHTYGLTPVTNLRSVFPAETVDRLVKLSRDTGLWWMGASGTDGGMGLSMLAQIVLDEEFNYCAVPFPAPEIPNILSEGTEAQRKKYLAPTINGDMIVSFAQTEPGAGSDPGGMMTTRAIRKNGRWVINGTKMWISGAHESDVILLQAVTDNEKRQRGGITMFLVDRKAPGVTIEERGIPTWLGPRAGQYIVHFDNVVVDGDCVLGPVGEGFRLGQRWLTIHDRLMRGPYSLGKMQRALDMSIAWAKQRVTFGKPIAERQAIQWRLVDMYVDLQALRSMTYEMASRADQGEDVRAEAALVKMCASEWGTRCIDHAIQIHGAMGESLELPLTYFYRLLRHTQIGGGTTEIQKILIARKLLKD